MKQNNYLSFLLICWIWMLVGCVGQNATEVQNEFSTPSANNIVSYSINGVSGVITNQNISLSLPYGTKLNGLVASFTIDGVSVNVNTTKQVSGITANDFTNPVIYTVAATDGSTHNYTVTVSIALNSAKDISKYSLEGSLGVITGDNIAVTVPYGSNIKSLIASFTTSGAAVKINEITQTSEQTPNDFTNPVTYTVTAADGSRHDYTVTVTMALNSAKDITAFSIGTLQGVITGDNIKVFTYTPDRRSLVANFTTTGISVSVNGIVQISGVTPVDFSTSVIYTVTAADGTTQDYTVRVGKV